MITAVTAKNVSESNFIQSIRRGGKGIPFQASEAFGKPDIPDRPGAGRRGSKRFEEETVVVSEDKLVEGFNALFSGHRPEKSGAQRSAGLEELRLESLYLDKKSAACVMNCSFGVGPETMDLRVISSHGGILVEISHDRNVSIANKKDVAKSIHGTYPSARVVWRERKRD